MGTYLLDIWPKDNLDVVVEDFLGGKILELLILQPKSVLQIWCFGGFWSAWMFWGGFDSFSW